MILPLGPRRSMAVLLALLLACTGMLGTAVSPASADSSYSVSDTVAVGDGPRGVAVSPDGSRVYTTNYNADSVSVIATATNTVSATVAVGDGPRGVAVSPDGSRVYTTNFDADSVSVIATATNTVSATVAVGDGPEGVAVSPDGSRVYVANHDESVSVIATATNTVSATVPVGHIATGVAVSPDGSRLYVTRQMDSSVSVISTATNTVLATVPVGVFPYGVAVSPDGSRVYVTSLLGASVSVIATATNTVSATVPVGLFATAVAVSPDGSRVYVAVGAENTMKVIATATNAVSASVEVGTGPWGLAVSPAGSRVYVSGYAYDTLSVVDVPPSAPAAPRSLAATAGDGSASISFTPAASGGSAITKYQYRVGSGAWTDAVGTSSPITVTGLSNGIANSVRLRAVNSVGAGVVSNAVSVTPRQAGPGVVGTTAVTPSGSTGFVVTFDLNPLPGTTVAYQSATVYLRGTNTVAGSCRTYSRQTTCYIGGLTRATNYDLRITAYLPVAGKTWHIATAEGSNLPVRTNN